MKLFTSGIDKKLFAQYAKGSDLKNQKVIAKIFNPYGKGLWFIINSDPNDPDYLWAIVSLDEVEVGSVSRKELENLRVGKFRLPLERDLYFTPMNAEEVFEGVREGKRFARGGELDSVDIDSLKKGDKIKITYSSGISNSKEVELEVRSKNLVNKGKSNEKEKVTFINVANPQGVKYYAYKSMKDGYVGFAIGDMAIWGVKEISKMAKGGNVSEKNYVAVSEKDGYWYIITRPTTKEKAQEMIDLGIPIGEIGKVVTLEEAKEHKKVIGKEYLAQGGYMAKGGELKAGVYRIGKPKKVSANLYEQKIVEIFDNGDIATASDYGRKMSDFLNQKYPIITQEQLDEQYKMAQGGYMAKGGIVDTRQLNKKIKDWYVKTYPSDDLGEEINDKVTFKSFWAYLSQGYNIYDVLKVGDSLVRERVFEKLSEIYGVDYDVVYKMWLRNNKYAQGGYMAQGGWLEHGIFQGDKILKTDGSFLIIEDKNGEIQVVNIEKGVRVNPMLDDSKMSGKRTMAEGDAMEAAENYIEFSKSSTFAKGGKIDSEWVVYVDNDQKIISTHKSRLSALRAMNELWSKGGYDSIGMGIKSDAFSDEYYAKGGHIGFDKLSQKVAKNYEGKAVDKEYQKEYGKRYDANEAREVGDKVAAKVYRLQLAKK